MPASFCRATNDFSRPSLRYSLIPLRKFGKQIQKRQLEVPEYAASFVNYKALKKVCFAKHSHKPLPQKHFMLRGAMVFM